MINLSICVLEICTTLNAQLFEINPRFSGTTNARALLGHNEPDMLCKFRLFGETPQKIEHKFGYVIRDLTEKYISLEDCERVPRL